MPEKRKRACIRKLPKLNTMLSRVACCSESWLQFREGKDNLGGGKKENSRGQYFAKCFYVNPHFIFKITLWEKFYYPLQKVSGLQRLQPQKVVYLYQILHYDRLYQLTQSTGSSPSPRLPGCKVWFLSDAALWGSSRVTSVKSYVWNDSHSIFIRLSWESGENDAQTQAPKIHRNENL